MSDTARALTRLLLHERPSLLRMIQRIVGDRAGAEDVTQGLWLRVQRIGDDPPIVHKRAFLYRLAVNLATDRVRADRRYDAVFDGGDGNDEVADDTPLAERQLIDRERLDRMMQAIDELSPRCREVFLLRKMEEMSITDICAQLGISRSMVARHMDTALRHLFARMQDDGE